MAREITIRPSPENKAYLDAVDNKNDFINSVLTKIRTGQLVDATAITEGKAEFNCVYNLPSLDEKMSQQCPVKINHPEICGSEHLGDVKQFCNGCPRKKEYDHILKMRTRYPKVFKRLPDLEGEPEPQPAAPTPAPKVPAVVSNPVETRGKPTTVQELPAGQALVGCDSCNETFIFDDLDHGLDDFTKHLKDTHENRSMSHNEVNQFRHARDRLERVAA